MLDEGEQESEGERKKRQDKKEKKMKEDEAKSGLAEATKNLLRLIFDMKMMN